MTGSGDLPQTADDKRAIRLAMKTALRHADASVSERVCDRLHALLCMFPPARIGCVWPMGDEVDLRPLFHSLCEEGWQILTPETPPKGSPLLFRQWKPACSMQEGRFGTVHPDGPVDVPDVILVPMLAFDRRGYRLGYGGGYYDRTLAALPDARPIGYAFSVQEVPHIPVGPFDVPLPVIVTEKEDIVPADGLLP
ncbi:5-formyltetrahydrofolate cyclo-ligase [Acetobacter sp.]|jgi:5-formyltetrahydrofolate cyclo-ligase|uniref:5-formyltetrahydrofolate cyclo-ligase n=1 Tax=Acetobacter sp. TaxID=440 RepID=UPI0025BBD366|nr:5-formyltetrahydrofolate cyclo-ligase [Acetobacter sp.]MCH4090316.1 5-formyltetrahydrofolate cyclo-ligase [Acetobacter sp.]MCI1299010.1 5-formyltetrahydrofolate cyclo-ligase [Acetobacter sp.]MCI1315030.1 5-formyltetrahydrofolate cyclo-ligase [Acetobacter sp.]